MAQEIKITTTLRYAKSPASASLSTTFASNQTGDKYEAGVASIATTETVLHKGDIGTIGYMSVRNNDTVNSVQLGGSTGVYSVKLLPGEGTTGPWQHANVYALANTAAVEVEFLLIEA